MYSSKIMRKREKLGVDFFRDRQLLTTLTKGSDRDAAILGGSILEELLNRLLRKKLVQSPIFKEAIENSNGSLSTFSNKIQLSYLMGLISKKMYDNLTVIRKIRNEFAHEIVGSSFENEQIKSKVEKNLTYAKIPLFAEWLSAASAKDQFLLHCTVIEVALVKKIVRYDSLVECHDETDNLGFEDIDWQYLESKIEEK